MPLSRSPVANLLMALLATTSGAVTVLGFAPFSWFPLALVGIAGFHESLSGASGRQAFLRGWLFGLGLLGFGVAWIRVSLNEFGNLDAWLADLLMAIFVAAMAFYYGLAGWLFNRLNRGPAWIGALLLLPAIYVLFEWLRGWLFTGFPWLNLGYTQIQSPLVGYAPIAGVYGVSLLTAISGGLLWGLIRWTKEAWMASAIGLVALWTMGLLLSHVDWTHPDGPPIKASVLQANIPQAVKWNPEARVTIARAYLELTRDHLDSQIILWPETALPEFLHQVREPLIKPLAERARAEGTEIVIGIPVFESDTGRYFNGLLSIGSQEDLYTKRHLVPFGEFMPFKATLGRLAELFAVPMSDFSSGAATRPLLKIGSYVAGASICYEDAFPSEVVQALPDAQFLINVSNDAWFGDSLAPRQHLEIARMRAIENGRDLLRATNTGISAIVDSRGRMLASVPSFVRDGATAEIQPRAGSTPFVHVHNWLALGLVLVMLMAGVLAGWILPSRATSID